MDEIITPDGGLDMLVDFKDVNEIQGLAFLKSKCENIVSNNKEYVSISFEPEEVFEIAMILCKFCLKFGRNYYRFGEGKK